MRVCTYNIRLGMQAGLGPIADTLRAADVDLVAIQEIGRHWIMGPAGDATRTLSELTGLQHFLFVPCISLAAGPAQYGHAVLSRFPLHKPRILALPQQVDEPRMLLSTTIVTADEPVNLITTHLSYLADAQSQITALTALLPREPWLVMGDLNLETDALLSLQDVGTFANPTFTTFPAEEPRIRIDHIVASTGSFSNVERLGQVVDSDHFGVVASWQPGRPTSDS